MKITLNINTFFWKTMRTKKKSQWQSALYLNQTLGKLWGQVIGFQIFFNFRPLQQLQFAIHLNQSVFADWAIDAFSVSCLYWNSHLCCHSIQKTKIDLWSSAKEFWCFCFRFLHYLSLKDFSSSSFLLRAALGWENISKVSYYGRNTIN